MYGDHEASWGNLAAALLRMPLPMIDVLTCIESLTSAVPVRSDDVLRSFST
jgi:hypothetical protein